jgi:F-type H+-transporting ATPase subunit a
LNGLLLAQSAVDALQHVVQHRVGPGALKLPTDVLFFDRFTFLSNHIIMQVLAAVVVCLVVPWAVRRSATEDGAHYVPRGLGNAIEGLCQALRVYVARPALGPYTDQFMPYIWSAFFFVLTCNLLGMIPLGDWTRSFAGHALGGTSTGNIMVTAALAICTLGMILVNGLRLQGMNFIKHFFMGPPLLAPMIAMLEVIGLLAKTFALAMRLFANMVAGHILLAVLLTFIGMAWVGLGTVGGLVIAVPVVLGSVAINFLELFVAFLQAFIFTFLSAMFIGQAVNLHHADEHHAAEAHADPHAPAHGH